jgi:hypothetical protein
MKEAADLDMSFEDFVQAYTRDMQSKLKENTWNTLLLDGGLNEYLHEIDEECYEMMDRLVEQIKPGTGITEELKADDQMKWVGLMNNVRSAAEEIVLKELVYV